MAEGPGGVVVRCAVLWSAMTKLRVVLFAALALGACSSGGGSAAPVTTVAPSSSTATPTTVEATTTVAAYVLPDDVESKIADCVKGAIRVTEDAGVTCVMAQLALQEEPLSKVNGVANALDDLTAMVVQRESGVKDWSATQVVNQAREVEARVEALG